ncbi:MAG: cupin domain-containing protein [Spirochaetaceae bacterium]|jgi:transcriptional regulator with XRE-family HTH domain|nr:cupin domain-containing protein [Spirochaetaceae bacterium]
MKNATKTPGARISEIRKTYSVSREDLSERSGVPLELIRKIEEEGLIPDLAPLIKISRVLGVRLGTMLDDKEELGPVISRQGERGDATRFITGLPGKDGSGTASEHKGLHYHSMAADKSGRHMEPFIVDIEPDSEQTKKPHEGEEFIYVMQGSLTIEYGVSTWTLNVGDSIYYDCIVPHCVHSADGKPVRILAVVYTPA